MRVFSYGRDLVPLYKKEGDSAKNTLKTLFSIYSIALAFLILGPSFLGTST